LREWIKEVLDNNREQFIRDLQDIDPEKRLALLENLLAYAVPKIQSISGEGKTHRVQVFLWQRIAGVHG
jgi:hypothetical protein